MIKRISFKSIKLFTLGLFILFVTLFTALIVYEEYNEFKKEIALFEKNFINKQKELVKKETLRALRYISYKHHEAPNKPLAQLQKEIIDAIEYMRNERDGTGYIFIYTFDGINVADPILKQNKGKNLINFTDPTGKKVIKELIEVSKKPDGGFVQYYWNKPTTNTLAPKISYAKAYKPFNWMVGSGVYLDEIEKMIRQKKLAYRDKMVKYIINILTLSFMLFFATFVILRYTSNLIERSLQKIKIRTQDAANHGTYIYAQDLLFNEFKEIAGYTNKMIKIIKDRTKKLQELNRTLELKVLQKTQKLNQQNEELKRSKEFTEKLLHDQDRFLKTAIHEINTPLSIILTNIDLLKMENIKNQELTNIESGIKIIHNIYNDLAYLLKKDRVEYKKGFIDVSSFLEQRVEFFTEVAKGNHLRFITKIEPDITLFINEIELQRIIDNNLSNAIKYSHINTAITIKLYKKDTIVLEFWTESKKIEDKEAIFKQFYREDRAKGGFGLGLALVKEICDKNGCTIEVDNDGKYNIFRYIWKRQ
ncbi:cache domain-containing protein [Nitratiruptor tergarcus]|uniref:histidine kinase n=1 Tax=Nitratiruptor tergarcus DSM 16512 TaxID=1069081 RepID=A0A1W1WSK5_9BACT|nr:cache domain-containing protein [Nitratiruptor tergarcus]SMC09185.1 His Kinase A (phospho-acceptor) domain-containing protein [Nitratiruptor tergarcus DSM 16512]